MGWVCLVSHGDPWFGANGPKHLVSAGFTMTVEQFLTSMVYIVETGKPGLSESKGRGGVFSLSVSKMPAEQQCFLALSNFKPFLSVLEMKLCMSPTPAPLLLLSYSLQHSLAFAPIFTCSILSSDRLKFSH